MLITDKTWDAIREQFTEYEKKVLRVHVTGETIFPRGIVIEESELPADLRSKLVRSKNETKAPLICRCGHPRSSHDDEPPYECFESVNECDLCECMAFEIAAKKLERTK